LFSPSPSKLETLIATIPGRAPARLAQHPIVQETGPALLPFDPEALEHLRRKVCKQENGCLVWTRATNDNGYGSIAYGGKQWLVHRLAWYAHRGPIPEGYFVCHACDNRACIAIDHLFLGTPQENVTDMLRKGRGRWKSRLNEVQVVDIKRRLASGEPVSGIARHYGVTYVTILAIKSGRNWRHVEPTGVAREGRMRQPEDTTRIPILEFASLDP